MRIQLLSIPGTVNRARVEVRIRKVLKKLGFEEALSYKGPVNGLIVIGNGTPDDVVITVLTHLLDGKCNAGLLIPTEKRFSGVKQIAHIMRTFRGKPVAFVIDQEDEGLKELYSGLIRKFSEFGIKLEPGEGKDRWREFFISGTRDSKMVVVVNGLDGYKVHKIEDHLLALHGVDLDRLPTSTRGDPKGVWKHLSSREEDLLVKVLEKLNKRNMKEYFPQHIELKRICLS